MATSTRPDDPAVTDRDARRIGTVAVAAHRKKTLDGGLDELRARLAVPGVDELLDAAQLLAYQPLPASGRVSRDHHRAREPRAYELDGGDRDTADRLTACVVPGGITVCVPDAGDQTRK